MEDLNYGLIGTKMKELRCERGITQEQIAKDLGCTIGFVSNVENNRAKLNLRVLHYYAELCHVPIDTFLNVGPDAHVQSAQSQIKEEELLKLFRKMSSAEQDKLLKTLHVWKDS